MIIQSFSRFKVNGSVDEDGSFAESRFIVDVDPASSDSRFEVETISSAPLGLGTQSSPQEAWLRLIHGGTTYYEGAFAVFEVALAPEGIDWKIETHGYSGDERSQNETEAFHGRAIDRGAAPPGSDEIDLDVLVKFDATTSNAYPVVTGGRAWVSDEPLADRGTTQISGSGYLSRFEGISVIYSKQPGDLKYHGEVIRDLLVLAGIDDSRIDISSTFGYELSGALDLECADGVAEARRVAESAGAILAEDGDGQIVVRDITPVDEAPRAEIDIERLETGEVAARIVADTRDVPLCWCIEGQRPEPTTNTDGELSDTILESETRAIYAKPQAVSSQGGTGTITSTGLAANLAPVETVIGQVWATRTFREGCLVRIRRVTWAWYVPEVHRYLSYATADGTDTGAGGVFKYNSGSGVTGVYFYDAGVVKDDSALAYAWVKPQFVPVLIEETVYTRDGLIKVDGTGDQTAIGWKGRLKQTVASKGEWLLPEAWYKDRAGGATTWESESWDADIKLRGSGEPIEHDELLFVGPFAPSGGLIIAGSNPFNISGLAQHVTGYWSSQSIEEHDLVGSEADVYAGSELIQSYIGVTNDNYTDYQLYQAIAYIAASNQSAFAKAHIWPYPTDGWIVRTTREEFGWKRALPAGDGKYLYPSGESDSATIEGQVILTTETNYVSQGDIYDALVVNRDESGQLLPSESTFNNQGHLPVADICIPELRDRSQTVPVYGSWCLESANDDFTNRSQSDAYSFGVETEAAAAELARKKLRERSALTTTVSLPISAIFRPKMPIIFRALHKHIDPDNYPHASNAWVDTVTMRTATDNGTVRRTVVLTIKIPVI